MDDDELKPMTDGDTTISRTGSGYEQAEPAKDTGTETTSLPSGAADARSDGSAGDAHGASALTRLPTSTAEAKQQLKDGADRLSRQAGEKALMFADQGKERATGALGQLSQMLTDAADQVDDKLGAQYGQYARTAAGTVQDFADQIRDKPVDDLVDEARALVRKSPGVAIGAAAAVGFVVARLVSAGLDQRDA